MSEDWKRLADLQVDLEIANRLVVANETQARKLGQQLAECQAREKAPPRSNYEKGVFNPVFDTPSDSEALDSLKKQW
jgi:hypothetical protein